MRPTKPWSTTTRNDKDPFERELQGGCVVTRHPRKRLAAKCQEETTHLKQESERSHDTWVVLIDVNESEKNTQAKKRNKSGASSAQVERQQRAQEAPKTHLNIWPKQVNKNGEELI